ncbi:MAG: hypothetical protein PHX83_06675 [Acidobacteriia bacterium]|nr:hypothetical protein [Terriglobia bacterium]
MFGWLKRIFKRRGKLSLIGDGGESLPWFRSTRIPNVGMSAVTLLVGDTSNESMDNRAEIEPRDLICAVEAGVCISTDGIDDKIKQLRDRQKFWKEKLKRRIPVEISQAIVMLEARKKYPSLAECIPWKTTTQERIDELCEKYKVDFRSLDDFIPELPSEAVTEVEAFVKIMDVALADKPELKSPKLFVIAPTKMFKTRKGDPILLAASPFGEFYYVLCAWDKEVRFVGELLS